MNDPQIVEQVSYPVLQRSRLCDCGLFQPAKEMPEMKTVILRMTNLHLHACGVFSNVYRYVGGILMILGESGKKEKPSRG